MGEGRISEYLDWWKMPRKTATKIINFCKNRLQVDLNSQDIDRVHRVGRRRKDGRPRAVIVKLKTYHHKAGIMQRKRQLKATNFFINGSDYNDSMQQQCVLSSARFNYIYQLFSAFVIGWNHFCYDLYTNKPDKVRFLCIFCLLIRHAIVPASFARFICGEPTEPEQTKSAAILNPSK